MAKRTTDIELPNQSGTTDLRVMRTPPGTERDVDGPTRWGRGDDAKEISNGRFTYRSSAQSTDTPSKKRAKSRKKSRRKSR